MVGIVRSDHERAYIVAEDKDSQPLDVVIVGGGLAGLTVAYKLRHKNILLLEKEENCGGRTISRKMGEYVYNTGAQVIVGDKSLAARLADEIGVRRTLIAKTKIPLWMKGKLIATSSEASFLWQLPLPLTEKVKLALKVLSIRRRFSDIVDKDPDPNNPKFVELCSTTLKDFVGATHPDSRAIWDTLSIASTMLRSHEVSALDAIDAFIQFKMPAEYAVVGGTWELTKALWNLIGDNAITSAEVREVKQQGDEVRVTYEKAGKRQTVRARQCVLATPAPIVLSIAKDLPDWKRDALSKVEYTATTSAAFLLDKPSEGFLGKGVWRMPVVGKSFVSITRPDIFASKEVRERTGQGLLRVYSGNEVTQKLKHMPDEEALEVFANDLESIFPGIKGKIIESSIKHWDYADPPWRIGRLELTPSIQDSTGNIHYCGDYTITKGLESAIGSAYYVLDLLEEQGIKA